MVYAFIILIQVGILYLSSLRITQLLISSNSNSRFKLIRYLIFYIFFLPGTFLHELSHFLMAKLLRVGVDKFNLLPTFNESKIILGSVSVSQTDFIRRFIIGVAPLFFGLIMITILVFGFLNYKENLPLWAYVLFIFLVFVISNTMFLSDKDLSGSWKFYLFLTILIMVLYFVFNVFGIKADFYYKLDQILQKIDFLAYLLIYPVALNLIFLLIANYIFKK